MAKPKIFVSSTYYDLKHIRASLDLFIESLGFEPILSEKGDVAYAPDLPLDESCYKEVMNADVLVIIIGGRYGSQISSEKPLDHFGSFSIYESITRKELETALEKDTPVYILIEAGVFAEYETFKRNKTNDKINYAHVDSVNIFHLIETILALPNNNPVKSFEKFTDIENWLKDQWAGLFRELLQRMSNQKDLSSLNAQVDMLRETNSTLKNYLETIIKSITPETSETVIQAETDRLTKRQAISKLSKNELVEHLFEKFSITVDQIYELIHSVDTYEKFIENLSALSALSEQEIDADFDKDWFYHSSLVQEDIKNIYNLFDKKMIIPKKYLDE